MRLFNRYVSSRGLTVFAFELLLIAGSVLYAMHLHGGIESTGAIWKIPSRLSFRYYNWLGAHVNFLYSYFQSGSSGCLRSHNGRRLLTTGRTGKLYAGGGEGVDHSRVHASHGSLPAGSPRKYDHRRFATKTNMAVAWKNTPIVTIRFRVSQPRPGSYV